MNSTMIKEMAQMAEGNRVTGTYHGASFSGVITRFTFSDKDSSFSAFVKIDAGFTAQFGISRNAGENVIIRTNAKHNTIARERQ
jgi:hypothetical protein